MTEKTEIYLDQQTEAQINAFASVLASQNLSPEQQESIQKAFVSGLAKQTPADSNLTKMIGDIHAKLNADNKPTKESILAIKDSYKRVQAIRENEHLFKGGK